MILTSHMDHGELHIILVDLGLAGKDEIRLVKVGEVLEVVDIPEQALDVPSHCSKCIELDGRSFSIRSLNNYC